MFHLKRKEQGTEEERTFSCDVAGGVGGRDVAGLAGSVLGGVHLVELRGPIVLEVSHAVAKDTNKLVG